MLLSGPTFMPSAIIAKTVKRSMFECPDQHLASCINPPPQKKKKKNTVQNMITATMCIVLIYTRRLSIFPHYMYYIPADKVCPHQWGECAINRCDFYLQEPYTVLS